MKFLSILTYPYRKFKSFFVKEEAQVYYREPEPRPAVKIRPTFVVGETHYPKFTREERKKHDETHFFASRYARHLRDTNIHGDNGRDIGQLTKDHNTDIITRVEHGVYGHVGIKKTK